MAGTPGGEKAGDYIEALLGLSWLEEHMQQTIGWGNMKLVYQFIAEELQKLYSHNLKEPVFFSRKWICCVKV